jgi:hypothetical protein
MAILKDLSTIANDPTFQGRCLVAAYQAAMTVMKESVGTTPDHYARAGFAKQILDNTVPATRLALAVLTLPAVSAEATVANISTDAGIPDAHVLQALTNNFSAMAGIANIP